MAMRRREVSAFGVLVLLALSAGGCPPPLEDYGFRGRVVNAVTGEPIPDATARVRINEASLSSYSPRKAVEFPVDWRGRFRVDIDLDFLGAKHSVVDVDAPGYQPATLSVAEMHDSRSKRTVKLTPLESDGAKN